MMSGYPRQQQQQFSTTATAARGAAARGAGRERSTLGGEAAVCCSAQTTQSSRPPTSAVVGQQNGSGGGGGGGGNNNTEDKRRRVDDLVARFHADRLRVSGERGHDVAVVFVAPGTTLDAQVIAAFRCASSERPFAPFDVAQALTVLPTAGAAAPAAENYSTKPHCYVLRSLPDNQIYQHQHHHQQPPYHAFDPYYCIAGCPLRAVRHYRIDFDALLRLLFYNRYRYVLKPIVVDRCLTASQSSSYYCNV